MPFSGLKVFETSFWDLIGAKEDCSKFKLHGVLHAILVGNDSSKTFQQGRL